LRISGRARSAFLRHVRFTPKSGHLRCNNEEADMAGQSELHKITRG
jgi:hypothetical protein